MIYEGHCDPEMVRGSITQYVGAGKLNPLVVAWMVSSRCCGPWKPRPDVSIR